MLAPSVKNGILNCTRQWGKSTVSAAKAIHLAATVPESIVVIISPSARQSGELVAKCRRFATRLGIRPRGDGVNEISLMLPNGSRIVGLPCSESTVRGFSGVNLLLVDEASRVDDELYQAVRPMLAASNGALWMMSTPFGKRGFFWETWEHSPLPWERVRVPATECPRISAEFLADEQRTSTANQFQQEYMCEFTESGSALFPIELLEACLFDDTEPVFVN